MLEGVPASDVGGVPQAEYVANLLLDLGSAPLLIARAVCELNEMAVTSSYESSGMSPTHLPTSLKFQLRVVHASLRALGVATESIVSVPSSGAPSGLIGGLNFGDAPEWRLHSRMSALPSARKEKFCDNLIHCLMWRMNVLMAYESLDEVKFFLEYFLLSPFVLDHCIAMARMNWPLFPPPLPPFPPPVPRLQLK